MTRAQADAAVASLKTVDDQYEELRKSWQLDARSVSQDALDNAANAVNIARSVLAVARRQWALIYAGA